MYLYVMTSMLLEKIQIVKKHKNAKKKEPETLEITTQMIQASRFFTSGHLFSMLCLKFVLEYKIILIFLNYYDQIHSELMNLISGN